MNAATLALQPSGNTEVIPPSSNSSDGNTAKPAAQAPTFAGAMHDAAPKSARKSTASKAADDAQSGASLPAAGNPSPPTPAGVGSDPALIAQQVAANLLSQAGGAAAKPAANPAGDADVTAIGSVVIAKLPQVAANAQVIATGAAGGRAATKLAGSFEQAVGLPAKAPAKAATSAAASAATAVVADADADADADDIPGAAVAVSAAPIAAPPTVLSTAVGNTSPLAAALARTGTAGKSAKVPVAAGAAPVSAARGGATAVGGTGAAGTAGAPNAVADDPGVEAAPPAAIAQATSAPGDAAAATADGAAATTAAATAAVQNSAAGGVDDSDGMSGVSPAPATAASGAAAKAAAVTRALAATASAATLAAAGNDDKRTHESVDTAASASGEAAAGLSQLTASALGATTDVTATPTPTSAIHASVDSAEFAQGLSDRVQWMVGNGINGAKIQLNPPQLGPIELRISVTGDHAQVSMTTHSSVTRDALESSTPKLREMLGAQGFGQVSVDISQRSFQDRSAFSQPYARAATSTAVTASPVAALASSPTRASSGVLDAYA